MSDYMLGFFFTAALFGMRKTPGKNPELWRMVWEVHIALGSPPLPMTAPWVYKK